MAVLALVCATCRLPAPSPYAGGPNDDDETIDDTPPPDKFGVFAGPEGRIYAYYAETPSGPVLEDDMGISVAPVRAGGIAPRAAGVGSISRLWPRGIIPYRFNENAAPFDRERPRDTGCPEPGSSPLVEDPAPLTGAPGPKARLRARVLDAMQMWEPAGIRFTPWQGESDFLFICLWDKNHGKSTSVGRAGGVQWVFSRLSSPTGGIAHELGHAIGLFHEHTRSDRDRHVRVNRRCIKPGKAGNYDNYIQRNVSIRDLGPYDYTSIMHYGRRGKSALGCDALTPIQNGVEIGMPIGQRSRPSPGDIAGVKAMYRGDFMQTSFREAPVAFAEPDFRGSFQLLEASSYAGRDLVVVRAGWVDPTADSAGGGYVFECNLPDRPACVQRDNWIRSIRVPAGVVVELCADASGQGRCITTSESLASLGDLAGRISRVRVRRAVTVFSGSSFAGDRRALLPNTYAGASVQGIRIGSAVVPPGLHLRVCTAANACQPFDRDQPELAFSSVTRLEVAPAATIYSGSLVKLEQNAPPIHVTLLPGTYAVDDWGPPWSVDHLVGPIVVGHGLVVRFCERAARDGNCSDWRGDVPDVDVDTDNPGIGRQRIDIRAVMVFRQGSCEQTWSCDRPPPVPPPPADPPPDPPPGGETPHERVCRLRPWLCDRQPARP